MFRIAPCIIVLASLVAAQGAGTTADTVTRADRGLSGAIADVLVDRALAGAMPAEAVEAQTERTLFLVVDPTMSVWKCGLSTRWARAMREAGDKLRLTSIGVHRIGDRNRLLLAPTKDHKAVVEKLRAVVRKPDKGFHDVCANLRSVASRLAKIPGRREILLICFDNADVEGDLERTVARLRKLGIRLSVITREAYLSDSYWESRINERPPKGTSLHASDGPFVDLPWGWIFQRYVANEIAPAGFAVYGMSRLAAGTGGRVYLYSPGIRSSSKCGQGDSVMRCLFCSGEHDHDLEISWTGRVDQLAPFVGSRKDAYREIASDPVYRAIDRAWRDASKARLISSRPSIKLGPTSASPQSARGKGTAGLVDSLNLKSNAIKSDKLRAKCVKILADLKERLAKVRKGRGSRRSEAAAALTQFHLQLAIVNLVIYSAWCRDVAPALIERKSKPPQPPEVSRRKPEDTPVWIYSTSLSLCHGVKLFDNVEMPGGDLLEKELAELDRLFVDFEARYGHTGYVLGLHWSGIAQFHILYEGPRITTTRRPRQKSKSKKPKKPTTPPQPSRPVRSGGSSGRSGGATTGGGR